MHALKKSIKVIKHNALLADSSKKVRDKDSTKPWMNLYKEVQFLKLQANEHFIELLAEDLVNWARKDNDALRIEDFHWDREICDKTFYEWVKKFDTLAYAHKIATNSIASRREKGMLRKTMPEGGVLKSLYLWDPKHEQVRQDEIAAKIAISKAIAEAEADKHYIYERRDVPSLQYDEPKMIESNDVKEDL